MTPLVWAILLLVSALALLALELLLPTGGILGVLAVASLLGSLMFVVYGQGYGAGAIYLAFLALLVPFLVVTGLRYWPHTSVGRSMLNVSPDEQEQFEPRHLHLIGKRGVARTKMLPSGAIKIGDQTYDAIAEGSGLEAGDFVEVIRADGTRIIVRKVADLGPSATSPQDSDDSVHRQISDAGSVGEIPDPFAESDDV